MVKRLKMPPKIAESFEQYGSVLMVCQPILDIIVLRILLRLRGRIRGVKSPTVGAMVVARQNDPSMPQFAEILIRGTARHDNLERELDERGYPIIKPVTFSLSTRIVDVPSRVRIVTRQAILGSYRTFLSDKARHFLVELSERDKYELRFIREDGGISSVRWNRNGSMKVRRSDYD